MMLCLAARAVLFALIPTVLYEGVLFLLRDWINGLSLEQAYLVMLAAVSLYSLLLIPIAGRMASCWMGFAFLQQDDTCGVWRATGKGMALMRGQRRQMIAFALSFVPWFIGGLFTLGILTAFGMMYLWVSLYLLFDRMQAQPKQQTNDAN